MSGEDAPRPYLENLIVLETRNKNKQTRLVGYEDVVQWGPNLARPLSRTRIYVSIEWLK